MPHLVQMDRKYSKKGMVLIGAEMQGSASESIKKVADDNKLRFTVTKGLFGPNLGGGGLPHMAVFGVDGNLVYSGHPSNPETEKAIKSALKDVKEGPPTGTGKDYSVKTKYLIDERTWTDADGKKLVAALVSFVGSKGKFRFKNGREFNYEISKLSTEDQELIKSKTGYEPIEEEEEERIFDF
ncbi:MAG: hypothetical protein ACJ0K4_02085 [Verrucomicrobiales bacterium]